MIKDSNIVIGVTGSIAAYKAVDIANKLTQDGANVDVVMTRSAQEFVTPLTFQTLTRRKVYTSLWDESNEGVVHIDLAQKADVVLIAPATANIIAKLANGYADDLLTDVVLATRSPVVIAPAMNVNMYENAITQENIQKLKDRGFIFIEPVEGRLACGVYGKGKLAETHHILGIIRTVIGRSGDMAGKKVVITAGGTREPIDPVRFISNRSSGKMGHALAEAARDRGALVTLITASTMDYPAGMDIIPVNTADEMCAEVVKACKDADALMMTAAVSDYKPSNVAKQKIKKSDQELDLHLSKNTDILSQVKEDMIKIGFAAESNDIIRNAIEKLHKKELDLIVANDITQDAWGFGSEYNKVTLIDGNENINELPIMTKRKVSDVICDWLVSNPKWTK
jgi:phosphopantothenoylcysteine decarboxylase/phosphopantothenate--cysteine ligase